MTPSKERNGILGTISAGFFTRSVINTANRFIYPFAPVIGRGLGVPLHWVTSVIALNQATALIGLYTSRISDRAGYKNMMMIGLVILVCGMLLAGSLPLYAAFLVAMFLSGAAKNCFDPAIQAYVGTRVSYRRRGLVIGVLEISWSVATLAGIPLAGVIISKMGWQSPFLALAGCAGIALLLVVVFIRDDSNGRTETRAKDPFFSAMVRVMKHPRALGAMGFAFCVSLANDNVFVIYGAWLEELFDFSVLDLGLGTAVIGIGELCGSVGTALLADRIGLKRSVIAGITICSFAYVLIALAGVTMWTALAALFLLFLLFEFSIVCFISMCTELIPEARATMMSLFYGAGGLGRVAGAFSGGMIWHGWGLGAVCITSFIINLVGIACLIWGIGRWAPGTDVEN